MRPDRSRVVLIHGLAETPFHMRHCAQVAAIAGLEVSFVAYPSILKSSEALLEEHVAPAIDDLDDGVTLHFVTHSLGGVLLHAYLQKRRPQSMGRVVMQAPGLHGSDALEVFRRFPAFRWLYGPASFESGVGPDGFAARLPDTVDYELGVIAGCLSTDLFANLFVPPPHDGKINVGRTKLAGLADHIVLPTTHDGIMHDPLALFQTLMFLHRGSFLHLIRTPLSPSTGIPGFHNYLPWMAPARLA